jgi:hypothetical protein
MEDIDTLIKQKSENFKAYMKSIVSENYQNQISQMPLDLSGESLAYVKSFLSVGETPAFLAKLICQKFDVKNNSQTEKVTEYVTCIIELVKTKISP